MRYPIIIVIFLSIGCTEKDPRNDNTNNSDLTAEFCEGIQDWETCNQAGCIAIQTTFSIVDVQENCTKKLQAGNICLLGESIEFNNTDEPKIYYKILSNLGTIGFTSSNFKVLNGWSSIHVGGDYCCRMDPEGCAETPWVDATDQWFPFEGLLD